MNRVTPEHYALATGEAAAHRLRILHGLYGPGSRRVLLEAGLRGGMRVADFERFLELSVAEAGPAFVEAGLITAAQLERTVAEMWRLNADETVLAVMPRMAQV